MILVIDANILFSALIKNSFTAELLFNEALELHSSEYIIEEFRKHEKMILRKTHRTREEFVQIMHQLNEVITVAQEKEYSCFMKEAKRISPDKDDALYFALAMKLDCAIWSNDKLLKQQSRIKVYKSEEILKML